MAKEKPKYDKLVFKVSTMNDEPVGYFEWGDERNELFSRYYEISEIEEPADAMKELQQLIDEDAEFLDAYNGLGWWEYTLKNYGNALSLFYFSYEIATEKIPMDFQGKIEWGFMENRPFLRTMHGLATCFVSMRGFENSIEVCNQLLEYNPMDNLAARALLVESYLFTGEYKKILKLCKKFEDDVLPDTLYGKFIAYFRLENMAKATESLKQAYVYSPAVAQEVVKSKHKKLKSSSNVMLAGSEEEAIDYWMRTRYVWNEPEIVKFIKTTLSL